MIHIFNKGTLRNQFPVRRKTKNRKNALSTKRILKQNILEKKLEDSWIKTSHFFFIAVIVFAVTYYLSPLLPLSPLNTPSLPLKTLHELNLLASNLDRFLKDKLVNEDGIENLLRQKYQGVTKLSFDRKILSGRNEFSNQGKIISDNPSQLDGMVNFQIPIGKDGAYGKLIVSQDISVFEKKIFWIRILISGSIALLLVAILVYKQTRRITDQVDVLCRHFVKFRRENDTGELYTPHNSNNQTLVGHRMAVLEDLWTRFQSMQSELAQNVEELEDSKHKLEKTVSDLQLAKEKERRLIDLGNTVAEFGHDIRNANGSISSFATLLLKILDKDRIKAMDVVQAITYIRRIKNSSNNVTGLTTEILDFASGKMEVRPEIYQLDEFQEQIESQLGFIEDFPLHYRVPAGQPAFLLRFDGRKIVRVIVNLVKNAWEKFQDSPNTRDGRPAQIEVRFIPQDMKVLKIQVVDNGSPIPTSILTNLFQSFQTEGKEKGTGLGLSIGKQLIEAHGGTIRACNLLDNRGVVFEILLPDCVIPAPSRSVKKENETFSLTA